MNCNLPGYKLLTCRQFSKLISELEALRRYKESNTGSRKVKVSTPFRKSKVSQLGC